MKDLQNIIQQSIAGQEVAQRALYLEFRVKWYMQCLRYGRNRQEADDILQEGLIQIYKDLAQFDFRRSTFITWSSRVISHAALRYLKKNSWHNMLTNIEDIQEAQDGNETVYEKLAAEELTLLIQQLPTGYRIVFNLFVLEGYSHQEIAEQLEITVGTSKSQLSKAKKMLRSKIEFHLTEFSRK